MISNLKNKIEVEIVHKRGNKVINRIYKTNKSFSFIRQLVYKIKHLI